MPSPDPAHVREAALAPAVPQKAVKIPFNCFQSPVEILYKTFCDGPIHRSRLTSFTVPRNCSAVQLLRTAQVLCRVLGHLKSIWICTAFFRVARDQPELPVSIHGSAVATILDAPVEESERRV